MDEEQKRYKNNVDTFTLLESDAVELSAEEVAIGEIAFFDVLEKLTTDRQRFIALALYTGLNKREICRILRVTHSDIVHLTRLIQIKLIKHHIRHRMK